MGQIYVKSHTRAGRRVKGYTRNSVLKAFKSVRSSNGRSAHFRMAQLEEQALQKVKNTHNFIKKHFPDRASKRLRYGLRVN